MKQILKLVFLLVIGQTAFGQAPSNYTNINGRYRWIAGMFDSTFHIPKGSTPSLRTGGSTNSGGLFYNTSDSSVYTYTGTQWIKLRGSINPSDTTNKYVTQVYKKSGSDSIFYVKGGVHTWAFNDSTGSPGGGGGGKVYYFNGGVSMGTFGGFTMYELGDTANTGAAANFTRATTGNIANFITDPNKPGLLQIPAGVWTVDAWLSETGGGANHAEIYVQVEKWDGSTITTIATSPIEEITEGGTPNLYTWSVSIPTTTLAVTDRIILQFYIQNTNGKTVTLYTQNGYVGEVHTTFTTGIGAINGLTAPAQYLVTGTSGTDFNINSSTATHTFNLPTASATNRGALSTTDWTTFNNKIGGSLVSGYLTKATGTNTIDTSQIYQSSGRIGVSTTSPQTRLMVAETASDGALSILGNASNVGTFKFYANNGSTIQSVVNSSSSAMQIGTFVNSEMNLITNSATRVSILNNGNVGIGSGAATDSMLTVENGARFKRGVRMSALPTGVGTKAVRIDANGTLSVADTLANGISGTGTTNYIPKFTSSSAIGNSLLYDNGTNVGIGTAIPSVKLEVVSSGATGSTITSYDATATKVYNQVGGTSGNQYLQLGVTASSTFFNDYFGTAMTFKMADSEKMRLTSGGLLGIGTSSPTRLLDVNGVIRTRDAGSAGAPSIELGTSAQGNGLFYPTTNTIAFTTNDSERMRIDASGNLGLGRTPAFRLDVQTSAVSGGVDYVRFQNGATNAAGNAIAILLGDASDNKAEIRATTVDANNGYLGFYTQGSGNRTEKMRLDASGNLGLGVTPSAWTSTWRAIQLPGGSIYSNAGGTTGQISIGQNWYYDGTQNRYINSAAASDYYQYAGEHRWFNAPSGTAGNAISFTQAMTLDASGNLGIGTSSPTQKLSVNGGASSTYIQVVGQSRNMYLGQDATGAAIYSDGAVPMYFSTNATERMRLDASGNLGINTSSPSYKLDVNGSGRFVSNANGLTLSASTGTSNTQYKVNNTSGDNYFGVAANDGSSLFTGTTAYAGYVGTNNVYPLQFATGGSVRATLDASGNLGLGVSPSAWSSSWKAFEFAAAAMAWTGSGANDFSFSTNSFFDATDSRWEYKSTGDGAARYSITALTSEHRWYNAPIGTAGNAISFTQAMTLDASGNLGVGTTSPQSFRLAVMGANQTQGDANTTMRIFDNTSATTNTGGGISFGGYFNGTSSSAYTFAFIQGAKENSTADDFASVLRFGTRVNGGNPTERMRITSGGEVVVNGTTPIYTAANRGNITLSGTSGILSFSISSANSGYVYHTGTNMELWNTANGYLLFATNNTERMRITSGGELLINTTSDAGDYKLQVNGNGLIANNLNIGSSVASTNVELRINGVANKAQRIHFQESGIDKWLVGSGAANETGNFEIYNASGTQALEINKTSHLSTFGGAIKTAAPSGGNAAAWKLGERVASSGVTFNDQQYIQLDIGGTLYYLATVDLPMPEAYPQATSGPSNNYKMAPVQVKTTRDAEIEKLRKEIEELKQLIKNK